MMTDKKVNLGYWLASQFEAVLKKKTRPLSLGSVISMLAVNLGVLDLSNHDMNIACDCEPLNVECLARMKMIVFEDECIVQPQLDIPPSELVLFNAGSAGTSIAAPKHVQEEVQGSVILTRLATLESSMKEVKQEMVQMNASITGSLQAIQAVLAGRFGSA